MFLKSPVNFSSGRRNKKEPPVKEDHLALNTILYCGKWEETLRFYRSLLDNPGDWLAEWCVEFSISETARLSVADENRASIRSAGGKGLTLSIRVRNIDREWTRLQEAGLVPDAIRRHPWGAKVFYLHDPEGNRIEIWTPG